MDGFLFGFSFADVLLAKSPKKIYNCSRANCSDIPCGTIGYILVFSRNQTDY